MRDRDSEQKHLEKIATWFSTGKGFQGKLTYYSAMTLSQFFCGTKVLELGCADGFMTSILCSHFDSVVSIDASAKYVRQAQGKLGNKARFYVTLFEDFEIEERFDTIICAHVLEHVANPVLILQKTRNWLNKDGRILIAVPNANSIHRKAGVYMGLLKKCDELNELDKKLGHRRIYSMDMLKKDILSAGLRIEKTGGIFFKPLSNKQIEEHWTEEMMDAFYELGKDFPENAAEIYAVCRLPRQ